MGGWTEEARLLLPVGHLLGASHPTLGSAEHTVHVRVGPELVELDDAAFAVWALAHGLPDAAPDRPWTRAALTATATERGLDDAGPVLDLLLADRLLVEVGPGPAAAIAFAEQHRLLPLALGLGDDPDEPGAWTIGLPGRPLVTVSATLFDVYEWAHLDDDLWAACRRAAERARRAGLTDPAAVDAQRLLVDVVAALHGLLSVGVACLDTRVARP